MRIFYELISVFCFRRVNLGRSAVCVFSLKDIKKVFTGRYKVLNRDTLKWSTRVQEQMATPGEASVMSDPMQHILLYTV